MDSDTANSDSTEPGEIRDQNAKPNDQVTNNSEDIIIEDTPKKEPEIVNLDSDTEDEIIELDNEVIEEVAPRSEAKEQQNVDAVTSSEPKDTNVLENKSDVSPKRKVDFFNLADSDSDEEENTSLFLKYTKLINFASEKSSVPCGPNKPTEQEIACSNLNENSCSKQSLDNSSNSGKSDLLSNTCSNLNDNRSDIQSDNDVKRVKAECTPEFSKYINDYTNVCIRNSRCIYREDERMIEAFVKEKVCRIPRQSISTYIAHSNVITSLNWCIPKHSYLFLSASLDGITKVWDIVKKSAVQVISNTTGIRAAKWSFDGEQIVTGGFGMKAHIYDVQTGKEITYYDVYNHVSSLEFHPYIEDCFLCGTKNAIFGFDLRVDSKHPIRTFFSQCDDVLDLAFLDEREFICSTSVVSQDSADRTIMVWDFNSGSILSNQIYLERYTCPSLKVHPNLPTFGAQTNGDYIALFSTRRPYKMKHQKYIGHKVSAYGIEFDFSPDGKYLASGDAGGELYFYNYSTSNIVHQTHVKHKIAVNRVKWHPTFSSTLMTATWDGSIQLWK